MIKNNLCHMMTNLYCGIHRIRKMKIKPVLWQRGESELDLVWRRELHCRCRTHLLSIMRMTVTMKAMMKTMMTMMMAKMKMVLGQIAQKRGQVGPWPCEDNVKMTMMMMLMTRMTVTMMMMTMTTMMSIPGQTAQKRGQVGPWPCATLADLSRLRSPACHGGGRSVRPGSGSR